jgi:heme exporter protein A
VLSLTDFTVKRDDQQLFVPIDLNLVAGDCVELLGRNGIGKSTLLRALCGLHLQTEGTFESDPFVYQGHRLGLDELMTPLENLAWFAAMEGASLDESRASDELRRVGLHALAWQPCARLSQGQQRRVTMARWLMSERRLWLLDEPFTALDREGQALLNEIIAEHCSGGGAVFCATHVRLDVADAWSLELMPAEQAA